MQIGTRIDTLPPIIMEVVNGYTKGNYHWRDPCRTSMIMGGSQVFFCVRRLCPASVCYCRSLFKSCFFCFIQFAKTIPAIHLISRFKASLYKFCDLFKFVDHRCFHVLRHWQLTNLEASAPVDEGLWVQSLLHSDLSQTLRLMRGVSSDD